MKEIHSDTPFRIDENTKGGSEEFASLEGRGAFVLLGNGQTRSVLERFLVEEISFEELIKYWYLTPGVFQGVTLTALQRDPLFRLYEKIRNSFCYYGMSLPALESFDSATLLHTTIQSFEIPLPDFSVTIDWTQEALPRGFSENAHVYLDSILGFFVHYKGEHVLTIGCSFTEKREVLIHQIQLVKKKRNRFLYKFPMHYMNWFAYCIQEHFRGCKVYCIQGESLALSISQMYYTEVSRWRKECYDQISLYKDEQTEDGASYRKYRLSSGYKKYKEFWSKYLSFRKNEMLRIALLYSQVRRVPESVLQLRGSFFDPVATA